MDHAGHTDGSSNAVVIHKQCEFDIPQRRWLKVLYNEKKIPELIVYNLVNANVPGADFIVQSSDGVVFYLHRKNLEIYTDGEFPGIHDFHNGSKEARKILCLDEPSSILEIVFQFVYPRRQPSLKLLKSLDFQTILAVADAVEKNKFFAAMVLCEEVLV